MLRQAWDDVISQVLELRRHEEYYVSKSEVPALPNYFEKRFGLPLDIPHFNYSLADGRAIHVKVYGDRYSVHWDAVDPIRNPLGHLLVDAPRETILAAAIIDAIFLKGKVRKSLTGM